MNNPARTLHKVPFTFLLIIGCLPFFFHAASLQAATYVHGTPLQFQWDASSGTVTHYNVYVSEDDQPYQVRAEVSSTSYQLNVDDGKSYRVQVEAENALGETGPVSDRSDSIVVFLNGSGEDLDGDGMPNSWEETYGFNPVNPGDGLLDLDSDGLNNRDEYTAGTLPTHADTDGDGMSDGEEVAAGLDPTNPADNVPVANAGPDQASDPTVITLDGTGSFDPNHSSLNYLWTQEEGPEVELSDPTVARPTFLGIQRGIYRFGLVVSGVVMSSPSDPVSVTIRNVAPSADAGMDRVVDAGVGVVLDGSGSRDPNEDSLSYSWTQVSGVGGPLSNTTAQKASFTPNTSGVFRFELLVHDGLASSVADTVQVVVNALNQVPTADAGGDQTVNVNESVVLDGLGSSDPDRDTLRYAWSQIDGPMTVSLEGVDTAQASFVSYRVGTYTFGLVVDDGTDASPSDQMKVTVLDHNDPPVALILQVPPVLVGEWVTLDGAGSFDPDGDPLNCKWIQLQGPQVTVEDYEAVTIGFYTTAEGTLKFQLVVNDGELNSEPVEVEVTVNGLNQVPVADAGENREVVPGEMVCLDGSASHDPDPEDVISYSWSQVAGAMISLHGADTASPCFTPEEPGVYTFDLSVFDGELKSVVDEVSVMVETRENLPPIAIPGAHQAVLPGTEVVLDGSGSYDLDGEIVEYSWEQTRGPSFPELNAAVFNGERMTFVPEKLGYYVFLLKVFDGELWSDGGYVVVWVTNTPPTNCSMLWSRPASQTAGSSEIFFVVTLFFPALGMLWYQKRRVKRS